MGIGALTRLDGLVKERREPVEQIQHRRDGNFGVRRQLSTSVVVVGGVLDLLVTGPTVTCSLSSRIESASAMAKLEVSIFAVKSGSSSEPPVKKSAEGDGTGIGS